MMIQQWWSRSSQVMLIQIERWSRSSDDVLYWSRSRDDPDPVMMFYIDPDREMIQIHWWCSMLIQIERWSKSSNDVPCWSRSRDDLDPMMMSHDDPDREMIQIQWWCPMMIQIERWSRFERRRLLEDSEDLRCRWQDDPVDTEKKTSAENCVERIPS